MIERRASILTAQPDNASEPMSYRVACCSVLTDLTGSMKRVHAVCVGSFFMESAKHPVDAPCMMQ